MTKRATCVLQANCLGKAVRDLLERSADFQERFKIHSFVNYQRDALPEHLLSSCSLFIHQPLGAKWGELSTETIQSKLPDHCRCIAFPAIHFRYLWPNIYNENNQKYGVKTGRKWPQERFEWGDYWVRDRVAEGWSADKIAKEYSRIDLSMTHDLDRLYDENIEYEREKEKLTDIGLSSVVLSRIHDQHVMWTPNHPSHAILGLLANEILRLLGMNPLSQSAINTMPNAYAIDVRLPIHPSVAAHFGINMRSDEFSFRTFSEPEDFVSWSHHIASFRIRVLQENMKVLQALPRLSRIRALQFVAEKPWLLTSLTCLPRLSAAV